MLSIGLLICAFNAAICWTSMAISDAIAFPLVNTFSACRYNLTALCRQYGAFAFDLADLRSQLGCLHSQTIKFILRCHSCEPLGIFLSYAVGFPLCIHSSWRRRQERQWRKRAIPLREHVSNVRGGDCKVDVLRSIARPCPSIHSDDLSIAVDQRASAVAVGYRGGSLYPYGVGVISEVQIQLRDRRSFRKFVSNAYRADRAVCR